MKFKALLIAAFAAVLSCSQAYGQATILPPGETCFSGNTGTNGMLGLLGSITGGSGYTNGTYGGVSLTGGSGSNATANITVSGGVVTAVTVLNPGIQYVVGDVLSASAASIGGSGSGFSVPVSSISINSSLAGGSVGFYVPNTQTVKQTWQDAGETILNQNPVPLDANGCAVVYGAGIYRMIVQDSLGNTVYDRLTASTGPSGVFWAGTAGGTGNAITVTDAGFASVDGTTIQFRALDANTGPTTITVSGIGPIPVVKDTSTGPAALSGSEMGPGNTPMVTYDSVGAEFHIVNPSSTSSGGGGSTVLVAPQGYLNLVGQASGGVVQTADVVGVSTLFYSPFVGSIVPVFNGTNFVNTQFSELTATITASGSPANTIQDACVFSNNGVPTLVLGPSWQNVAVGTGSRGTGAGTAQLNKLQGIWVNANAITGYNGLSSYSIPASQCTYVGSVWIDSTAGQVSAYRTPGQSRKFGVWNAYNRQTIVLQMQDSTGSWVDGGGNRWTNSNFNSLNNVTVFAGLAEEQTVGNFSENLVFPTLTNETASAAISFGVNSTSTPASYCSVSVVTLNSPGSAVPTAGGGNANSKCTIQPFLGINTVYGLENPAYSGSSANITYLGGVQMLLTAQYRG